jgi:hypothetical protein
MDRFHGGEGLFYRFGLEMTFSRISRAEGPKGDPFREGFDRGGVWLKGSA